MKKRYPIPEKIFFDDTPIGTIVEMDADLKDSQPLSIPEEYQLMDGSVINDPESPLNGVVLPDWNNPIKIVDNTDFTGTGSNLYPHVRFDNLTTNRNFYFPNPEDYPIGYKVKVTNYGSGAYKVILNRYGTSYINVFSGNDKWNLTSFELLQAGDWAEFENDGTNWVKCNTPYWHIVDDPTTGKLLSKSSWTIDSFSEGHDLTVTGLPIGSLAAKSSIWIKDPTDTNSQVWWRKSGDTNISNTPKASDESTHKLCGATTASSTFLIFDQVEYWVSSDRKVQLTSRYTTTEISLSHIFSYYQ